VRAICVALVEPGRFHQSEPNRHHLLCGLRHDVVPSVVDGRSRQDGADDTPAVAAGQEERVSAGVGDPVLPQRDQLLDADTVGARLGTVLGQHGPIDITSCVLVRSKYRIGESLRVVYRYAGTHE